MKEKKKQVARYGLHYYANNQLIPNISDRVLFQCLVDMVRKQLAQDINNQTVLISANQLGRLLGLEAGHTIPACIKRLEKLGLVKKHKNGITVNCDEYATAICLCETLDENLKPQFLQEFTQKGTRVLENYNDIVKLQYRESLLGVSGSSMEIPESNHCKITEVSETEGQNTVKLQYPTQDHCKITEVSYSEVENTVILQSQDGKHCNFTVPDTVILQEWVGNIAHQIAFLNNHCNFTVFLESLGAVILQYNMEDALEYAFHTGKFPKTFLSDLQNHCNFTVPPTVILQYLASKTLEFYSTVIIEDKKKKIIHAPSEKSPLKKGFKKVEPFKEVEAEDEDFQESEEKHHDLFANFGKVEVIDFSQQTSDDDEEEEELEDDFLARESLKRAERALRNKNPYRNKPFLKVEKVKEVVDCLDEVVQSPVDFFLYQFWWGVFDLYLDHYNPSNKFDEQGDPIEEDSQLEDWREMIGAPIPQDELYQLAYNVYEDMKGYVEQGKYIYGDHNEWEVIFDFQDFEDFNPCQIFQWKPCTMQDKSIPALKVAIDSFYDVEAEDISVNRKESRTDRATKVLQDKKLIRILMEDENPQLTPMETAIKRFYEDFVVWDEDFIVDLYKDGRGTVLESRGGLPDHLLKPWCFDQPSVTYSEFTGTFATKYWPIDGLHKKAYPFSAEAVVEWNERNGYRNSLAHEALKVEDEVVEETD